MRNSKIQAQLYANALAYARKIYMQYPNYTLENARKIFKVELYRVVVMEYERLLALQSVKKSIKQQNIMLAQYSYQAIKFVKDMKGIIGRVNTTSLALLKAFKIIASDSKKAEIDKDIDNTNILIATTRSTYDKFIKDLTNVTDKYTYKTLMIGYMKFTLAVDSALDRLDKKIEKYAKEILGGKPNE